LVLVIPTHWPPPLYNAKRIARMFEIDVRYRYVTGTIIIDELSLRDRTNGQMLLKHWLRKRPEPGLVEHSTFQLSSESLAEAVFEAFKDSTKQSTMRRPQVKIL
jgi:hypothetical protein